MQAGRKATHTVVPLIWLQSDGGRNKGISRKGGEELEVRRGGSVSSGPYQILSSLFVNLPVSILSLVIGGTYPIGRTYR